MTDEVLKSCPFCGGKGIMHPFNMGMEISTGTYIRCIKCGAETRFFDTQKKAIKAWNKRVDSK